jgi:glyoxylase-like metal-dependent hydrolase (beta-lactamase superfamily II)
MLFESFPVGPLKCNCSIIACKETLEAAIIDPGGDAQEIISLIEKHKLKPKYLLHTHAHFDHVIATREVKEATGAKILLHRLDQFLYDNLIQQGQLFGIPLNEPLPVDDYFEDESEIEVGKVKFKVLHTPGHTPGSTSFYLSNGESILFSGDTLFAGSIGRTDLWGGSFEQIIQSISDRLFVLDDETRVIPGHGPDTTIWTEKKENPFFK